MVEVMGKCGEGGHGLDEVASSSRWLSFILTRNKARLGGGAEG